MCAQVLATVRRYQKLFPCWAESVPASSETVTPLAKAELSSDVASASVIICGRKGKNVVQQLGVKEVEIYFSLS